LQFCKKSVTFAFGVILTKKFTNVPGFLIFLCRSPQTPSGGGYK
jgi:hypothetical protein